MQLPPKVQVGFRAYDVYELPAEEIDDEGDEVLGRHHWKGTIGVNLNYQPAEIVNSMIHEVLHAIIDVYNIPIDNKELEEMYVRQLAGPLTALIKDNPDLMIWMVENCQTATKEKASKAR